MLNNDPIEDSVEEFSHPIIIKNKWERSKVLSTTTTTTTTTEKSIRGIGVDIGTVNFAICMIDFKGFIVDEETLEEIPQFDILRLQIWNLKINKIYDFTSKGYSVINMKYKISKEKYPYLDNTKYKKDSKLSKIINERSGSDYQKWRENFIKIIMSSEWMFKKYRCLTSEMDLPFLAVENQMDQVSYINKSRKGKTSYGGPHKVQMYTLSNILLSTVRTKDLIVHNSSSRITCFRAAKYGISHNGQFTYNGRKNEAILTGEELLKDSGNGGFIKSLNKYEEEVRLVSPSGKSKKAKKDDAYDCVLLNVKVCIELYLKYQKKKGSNNDQKKRKEEEKEKSDVIDLTTKTRIVEEYKKIKKRKRKRTKSLTFVEKKRKKE
jgi:hypothetical protein